MWPYWMLLLLPAAAAFAETRRLATVAYADDTRQLDVEWFWVAVAISLLIGLRYEVGGDWGNYLSNLEQANLQDISDVLTGDEPGYRLLEWFAIQFDWGIVGVNLIGGTFFGFCLAVFCREMPRRWLALTVAIPYLVIVVAMGYTRQGIAIGFAMLGMVAMGRGRVAYFVAWVLLAATFHKSAVLLLPIAALAAARKNLWVVVWVGLTTLVAYWLMLEESIENIRVNYLEAEYQSEGALIRLLMNVVPAVILLLWHKRFVMELPKERLWRWFSIISLGLLVLYFVSPSSTAVDRVALYMLPLQLTVLSYLPGVFGRRGGNDKPFVIAVVLYSAAIQFVWLNYATHAEGWIPYRFYPLEVWF